MDLRRPRLLVLLAALLLPCAVLCERNTDFAFPTSIHRQPSTTNRNRYNTYEADEIEPYGDDVDDDDNETDSRKYSVMTLESIQKIENIKNTAEILSLLNYTTAAAQETSVGVRSYSSVQRSGVLKQHPDAPRPLCMPRDTLVEVDLDGPYDFVPTYVLLPRCGGCCMSRRFSCQPTYAERIEYKIKQLLPSQEIKTKIISMEIHKACQCLCNLKALNCSDREEYNSNTCECVCGNQDEKEKCELQENKKWYKKECTCACKKRNCGNGLQLDPERCKCRKHKQGENGVRRRRHNTTLHEG